MHRMKYYISAATLLLIILNFLALANGHHQNPTEDKPPANKVTPAIAFVTGLPDSGQAEDITVPVFLNGVTMAYGFKEYEDQAGIKGGLLVNRSSKNLVSVKISWFSTTIADAEKRQKIFQKGELELIKVDIKANRSKEIEFKIIGLKKTVARWMEENPSDKRLAMTFSVSEATFEDGSTWKEEPAEPKS